MGFRGNYALPYLASALIVGLITGYYLNPVLTHQFCETKYEFVNSGLVCSDHPDVISKVQYVDLRLRLENYIERGRKDGTVSDVAVYFRDLHQGPVMGINEVVDFAPASLLKLPLAMLYELEEEKNHGFIDSIPPLGFTSSVDSRTNEERMAHPTAKNMSQAYPPPEEIVPGERYKVEDLLFRMLAYSDNEAFSLLSQYIITTKGESAFTQAYKDLGLIAVSQTQTDFVSVRSYASLYRLLYNSSFVNAEYSEKLLRYMSKSSFRQGLEAGVPKGVVVAHKFGERGVPSSGDFQLHDCGIIYYPGNPYLLCVMTKGRDMSALATTIAHISQEVYREVDSRRL